MPAENTTIVLGFDWDNCAATLKQQNHTHESLREIVSKEDVAMMDTYMQDVLLHPIPMPNHLFQRVGQPHLISFSLRAGWWQDELFNAARNGTLMCDNEQGLPEISRRFDLKMVTLLLADILAKLKPGTTHDLLAESYKERTQEMSQMLKYLTHSASPSEEIQTILYDQLLTLWRTMIQNKNIKPSRNRLTDPCKGLLLLHTAFFAANIQQEGTTQVHLHIIDDRPDILIPLQRMIKNRPDILPKHLTVAFHRLHPEFCDEEACAQQVGQAIRGTGDHPINSHFSHEDLIRKIYELSKDVNTRTWVNDNEGAVFCQIHDEALKQIKQAALEKTASLQTIEKSLFVTPGTSLWQSKARTSHETDRFNQRLHNVDNHMDTSTDILWCNNQVSVSTRHSVNTGIQGQQNEHLLHGQSITDIASPQSYSETLFFDSTPTPIFDSTPTPTFRWTKDEVVNAFKKGLTSPHLT